MKKTKNIERFKFYGGYTVLFTICMICTSFYFFYNKFERIEKSTGSKRFKNLIRTFKEDGRTVGRNKYRS